MDQEIRRPPDEILPQHFRVVHVAGRIYRREYEELTHPSSRARDRYVVFSQGESAPLGVAGGDVPWDGFIRLSSGNWVAYSALLRRGVTTDGIWGGGPLFSALVRGLAKVTTAVLSLLPLDQWRTMWEFGPAHEMKEAARRTARYVWRDEDDAWNQRLSAVLGESSDHVIEEMVDEIVGIVSREALSVYPKPRMADVARCHLIDLIRRATREKRGSGELAVSFETVEEAVADETARQAMGAIEVRSEDEAFLARCDPDNRRQIKLWDQGYTNDEIARKTGVTPRTVRNRWQRIAAKLPRKEIFRSL